MTNKGRISYSWEGLLPEQLNGQRKEVKPQKRSKWEKGRWLEARGLRHGVRGMRHEAREILVNLK